MLKRKLFFPYANLFQNRLTNPVKLSLIMEFLPKCTLYKHLCLCFLVNFVFLKLKRIHYLSKIPLDSNES